MLCKGLQITRKPVGYQPLDEFWKKCAKQSPDFTFPEYGAMEITSLFSESERTDLRAQAKKFLPFVEDFKRTFSELAKKHNVYIIAPSLPLLQSETLTTNRVFVFAPDGKIDFQDKFFMTRFEDEEWNVKVGEPIIKVFDTG